MKKLFLFLLLLIASPAWAEGVWSDPWGTGVTASAAIADNAIVRGDGGASGIQSSGVQLNDSDLMQFPATAGAGVLLPLENDAITPTLGFGDGGEGFFQNLDNNLRLSLDGVVRVAFDTNQLWMTNGAALLTASPTSTVPVLIPNNADLNTGIGWAAADKLSLIAGGVGTATVTSTGVGVGTVIPLNPLHIVSADNNPLLVESTDSISGVSLKDSDTTTSVIVQAVGNDMRLLTNGGETVRILANGNVGVGTTIPQSLLDVQAAAGSPGLLTLSTKELTVVDGSQLGRINFNAPLESDGADAILPGAAIWAEADATFNATNNSTELVFGTATTSAPVERVRIDSAGNVGFGTSTPVCRIDAGITSVGSQVVNVRTNSNSRTGLGVDTGYGLRLYAPSDIGAANPLFNFGTMDGTDGSTFVSKAVMLPSGYIGIGTAAPTSPLEIKGSDGVQVLRLTNAAGNTVFNVFNAAASGASFEVRDQAGTVKSKIDARSGENSYINNGGNVGIGTSTPRSKTVVYKDGNGEYPTLTLEAGDTSVAAGQILANIDFYSTDASTNSAGVGARIQAVAEAEHAGNRETGLGFWTANLYTGPTEKVRIDELGNVGIGTTTPGAKLDVTNGNVSDTPGQNQMIRFGQSPTVDFGLRLTADTNTLVLDKHYSSAFQEVLGINRVTGNVGIGTIAPATTLDVNGGQSWNVTTVNAATYDLLVSDHILNVTYTATGAVTSLTLPTAQTTAGRVIVIKDAGGNASINNITIDCESAQTIDGVATKTLTTNYESISLYSDGNNWFIF